MSDTQSLELERDCLIKMIALHKEQIALNERWLAKVREAVKIGQSNRKEIHRRDRPLTEGEAVFEELEGLIGLIDEVSGVAICSILRCSADA